MGDIGLVFLPEQALSSEREIHPMATATTYEVPGATRGPGRGRALLAGLVIVVTVRPATTAESQPVSYGRTPHRSSIPVMHVVEPSDASWDQPLPVPRIPDPPAKAGLTDQRALRDGTVLLIEGETQLAAEAAKQGGLVTGKGTKGAPYVIRNLRYTGLTDTPGITVKSVNSPLVIENVLFDGRPLNPGTPADTWGLLLVDCENTVVRHCQVSRCLGMHAKGKIKHIRFDHNYGFSCDRTIFSGGGSHISAKGNYVRDALQYGVFLYNGTDNTIEDCYVAWTGREGIGSHANCARGTYRRNVILHTGWTAINVEAHAHDSLVEGNLIVDTHYGIILMGNRTVCRNNRFFYCSQMGISVFSNKNHANRELVVEGNLVVGCGQPGIDVMPQSTGVTIVGNRVLQAEHGIDVRGPKATVKNNTVHRYFRGIVVSSTDFTVTGNRVFGGRNGIVVEGPASPSSERPVPNGVITGNDMHHSIYGLSVKHAKGVVLADNTITSVGVAASAQFSSKLTVRRNVANRCSINGIMLRNCTDCAVEANRVHTGVVTGIRIDGGHGHTVSGNSIADIMSRFWGGGITLRDTRGNRITKNTIERCPFGVAFYGKNNRDNVLTDNTYRDGKTKIAMRQGAADVGKTNRLDAEPIKR